MSRDKKHTFVGALVVLVLAVVVGSSVSGERFFSHSNSSDSDVLALTTTNSDLSSNFKDNFKSTAIDVSKWTVLKTGNTGVKQSATNNLVINVPAGSLDGKTSKSGRLVSKQLLGEGDNFRVVSVLYRPVVTGEGLGVTGVRFGSDDKKNDEGAIISWNVNSNKEGKLYFYVKGSDGKRIETKVVNLNSNQAVFRLDRVNDVYFAYYKTGNDTTSDKDWTSLGKVDNSSLGASGFVTLFANNAGEAGKYPAVLSRFDSLSLAWEGGVSTLNKFADSFSNKVVEEQWKKRLTPGSTIVENASDNMVMRIPSGVVSGKPGSAYLKRLSPRIPANKDFSLNTLIYKPVVSGSGLSASGLSFVSSDEEDKEAAKLMWQVGGSTNKLVFAVRNDKGVMSETALIKLKQNVKSLTMRLTRRGDKYSAWYRTGDGDTDFIKIGSDKDLVFGSEGTVGLFSTNLGSLLRYPSVAVRFDSVSGSVEK